MDCLGTIRKGLRLRSFVFEGRQIINVKANHFEARHPLFSLPISIFFSAAVSSVYIYILVSR
jgi:hypothetical protein